MRKKISDRIIKAISIHCFLLLVTMSVFYGCSNENAVEKKETTVLVKTIKLKVIEYRQKVNVAGKLEAWEKTNLAFKIGGRIENIKNDVGDFIKAGSVTASLDQDEIKAKASQAELAYKKIKRDHERVQSLYKENAATRSQLQDMTTALNNAEEQLKVARYNLKHSHIIAPYDGYIAMRRHEPGEMISAGDPVFIFVSNSEKLKISTGVAGKYISQIKVNDSVEITTDSHPGKVYIGKVNRCGITADPITGTFPVEIVVSDTNSHIRPGMVVEILLNIGDSIKLIFIPLESLVEADEDRGYVFIYNCDTKKAERRPVRLGDITEHGVIVTDGVKEGEEIIVEGAQYLIGGEKVSIHN